MSLSLQTQQRLADLFIVLYEGERQAEIMRQVLVEQQEFYPVAIFNHLSQGKDVISLYDLQSFLDHHSVTYTSEELKHVISSYSKNEEELTYNNFLNIILPSLAASLRHIKVGKNKVSFTYHIECALSKVLQQEIELQRQIEAIKEEIIPRWDFSEEAAFSLLESFGTKGQVDHMALKRFFNALALSVTEDDLLYLLRRTDRDKDSRISRSDFAQLIHSGKHIKTPQKSVKSSRPNSHRVSVKQSKLSNSKNQTTSEQTQQASPQNPSTTKKILGHRKSTGQLFKKIPQLSILSPSINHLKVTDRGNAREVLSATKSSFTRKSVSPFDPLGSSIRAPTTPNKNSISVSPHQRNDTPNQQSITTTIPNQYKYYGVDSKQGVINEDTSELVNLFIQYIEQYQVVDQSRCQIVHFPDFNLDQMWIIFTQADKSINMQQFERISAQIFGCHYSQDQLKNFFQLVDLDRDGQLNYEEFVSIFEPSSEYYANIMYTQNEGQTELSGQLLEAVKILIDQMIDLQLVFTKNKQLFFQRKRYSLLSLFEHLNSTKNGYLSVEDFVSLFQRFGCQVTNSEVVQVMCKFTRDKLVKRVTMRQFLNELTPNQ